MKHPIHSTGCAPAVAASTSEPTPLRVSAESAGPSTRRPPGRWRSPLRFAGFAALAFAATAVASTVVPAKRPAPPVLLRGGTVHTVSGAVLEKTDLLMADGKIAALGAKLKAPAGATVVDVAGKHLYPGFISANSQVGVAEILSVRATIDTAEIGPVNPNARAQVAVNPESELIPVTRLNGVLTAHITPQTSSEMGTRPATFAGTSALVRLDGWTWEDMTIRASTAMQLYWPATDLARNPRNPRGADDQRRELAEKLKLIRDTFAAARAYGAAQAAGRVDTDLRLEALLPVLRGEVKLFVHANTVTQIASALDWAAEEKLPITLVGGRDAWMIAGRLKDAGVGVILAGTFNLPARRDEAYDTPYAAPGKLHAAGVKFCIAMGTDGASEPANERNLPYEAAIAAGFGLPRDEALRSVTLSAAELLGVAGELGSLEVGKRATLFVADGDALELTTNVLAAYIDGAQIDLRSRQTDLYQKYRQRLGQ